jgi:hypothetical protein
MPNPILGRKHAFDRASRGRPRVRSTSSTLNGAVVRRVLDRDLPAGAHHVHWDARTDKGSTARSGLYFVHVQAGSAEATTRLVLDAILARGGEGVGPGPRALKSSVVKRGRPRTSPTEGHANRLSSDRARERVGGRGGGLRPKPRYRPPAPRVTRRVTAEGTDRAKLEAKGQRSGSRSPGAPTPLEFPEASRTHLTERP